MQHLDLLMTMAEVAVAFAGFTGVVGVFGYRISRAAPQLQVFLIGAMIGFSLIAAFFSFAPLLLSALGMPEAAVWRVASGGLALAMLGWTAFGLREARRLVRLGYPRPPLLFSPLQALLMLAVLLVLLANSAGLFGFRGPGVYLVGAFSPLLYAGVFFMSLVFSLRSDP